MLGRKAFLLVLSARRTSNKRGGGSFAASGAHGSASLKHLKGPAEAEKVTVLLGDKRLTQMHDFSKDNQCSFPDTLDFQNLTIDGQLRMIVLLESTCAGHSSAATAQSEASSHPLQGSASGPLVEIHGMKKCLMAKKTTAGRVSWEMCLAAMTNNAAGRVVWMPVHLLSPAHNSGGADFGLRAIGFYHAEPCPASCQNEQVEEGEESHE